MKVSVVCLVPCGVGISSFLTSKERKNPRKKVGTGTRRCATGSIQVAAASSAPVPVPLTRAPVGLGGGDAARASCRLGAAPFLVGPQRFHVLASISWARRDEFHSETGSVGDETARCHAATNSPTAFARKAVATVCIRLASHCQCQRYSVGKENEGKQGIVELHCRFRATKREDFVLRIRWVEKEWKKQ
jgi:hypothetical protein